MATEYSESDEALFDKLKGDELPLCSIEIRSKLAGVTFDQSGCISYWGDSEEARKCVQFLFPKTLLGHQFVAGKMREVANYSINRDVIKLMQNTSSCDDYLAILDTGEYALICKGPKEMLEKLIDDIHAKGGVDFFDKARHA
jgi:hypothetical protein